MENQSFIEAAQTVGLLIGSASILLLSVILFQRAAKALRESMKNKVLARFEPLVFDFIYSDNKRLAPWLDRLPTIPILFSRKKINQFLSDYLLGLKKNFKGKESLALSKFYRGLRLHNFSIKKLRSKNKYTVIKGLAELKELDDRNYFNEVLPHLKSKDREIKVAALRTLIRIVPQGSLHFLNRNNVELSEWDLINIHSEFSKKPDEIPSFKVWLKSKHKRYVKFSIKMITQFKQFEAIDDLASLLSFKDEDIVIETLIALRKLEAFQILDSIVYRLFMVRSRRVLIEYLRTISALGGSNHKEFLEAYCFHKDEIVRSLACKIQNNEPLIHEDLVSISK